MRTMSSPQKLMVLALLGFLAGAVLGVVVPLFIGTQDSPVRQPVNGLAVACAGGSAPVVTLSWVGGDGGALATIERSVAGGAWSVGGTVESDAGVFYDNTVVADTAYAYRLSAPDGVLSSEVIIETDDERCPLH